MKRLENIDVSDLFVPVEGYNTCYYGKTRNGKTSSAVFDIWDLLARGEVVYANFMVRFPNYDERFDKRVLFSKVLFFRQSKFFVYKADNFIYINPEELMSGKTKYNIHYLNRLVGVHLFLDEGQWILPSMDRKWDEEAIAKMKLVLHGGHYCRSLNIITQRPSNISANTRSQIHIWIRCVKKFSFLGFIGFSKFYIEDTDSQDKPIEYDSEGKACGSRRNRYVFAPTNKILNSYDTHAMRGEDAIYPNLAMEVYHVSWLERVWLLVAGRTSRFARRALQEAERPLTPLALLAPLKSKPEAVQALYLESSVLQGIRDVKLPRKLVFVGRFGSPPESRWEIGKQNDLITN